MQLKDLKQNPKNPRRTTDKRLEALKGSLDKFGDLSGFIFNQQTQTLIGGHQRHKVMPSDAEIVIEHIYDTPTACKTVREGYALINGEKFKYREVDADVKWETEAMLAANRNAGEWDLAMLDEIKLEIPEINIQMEEIKLEPESEPQEKEETEPKEEIDSPIPEAPLEITIKPGEEFQLGDSVLRCGDCIEAMKQIPDNCMDSMVTDPPAGISFMGKEWDDDKGGRAEWIKWLTDVMREAYRTMKPGAHGLVWAIPRTNHWTGNALEQAGFEVRDVITHLYGTGFPKSLDISKAIDKAAGAEREVTGKMRGHVDSNGVHDDDNYEWKPIYDRKDLPATDAAKQWDGWGTALKPACEFWYLVRKPISENTIAENVLKWGTGGLNIDASRIEGIKTPGGCNNSKGKNESAVAHAVPSKESIENCYSQGRFPANLILDEAAAEMLDEQVKGTLHAAGNNKAAKMNKSIWNSGKGFEKEINFQDFDGGASRFFYVAKASQSEKNAGLEHLPEQDPTEITGRKPGSAGQNHPRACIQTGSRQNIHPTVKPIKLMEYLIKLITPPKGVILEPFGGSGTTLIAAVKNGFSCQISELSPEYCHIIIERWKNYALPRTGFPLVV